MDGVDVKICINNQSEIHIIWLYVICTLFKVYSLYKFESLYSFFFLSMCKCDKRLYTYIFLTHFLLLSKNT